MYNGSIRCYDLQKSDAMAAIARLFWAVGPCAAPAPQPTSKSARPSPTRRALAGTNRASARSNMLAADLSTFLPPCRGRFGDLDARGAKADTCLLTWILFRHASARNGRLPLVTC